MFAIKLTQACTDTTLPILERDQLLVGDNGGVRFLFDMAFPFSYAGGTPVNGSPVKDVAEVSVDAQYIVQAGEALSFAGGGADLSALTKYGTRLEIPASVAANIWASTNQYFLNALYVKLPTQANWNTSASLAAIQQWANTTYQAEADLLVIAEQAANSAVSFRRQKAAATADTLSITPNALDYGSVVQLAFWRDATGQYARLRSVNGTVLVSGAVSTNNTQDFSAFTGKVGNKSLFGGADGAAFIAGQTNAWKMRFYRGFVENLETSGRSAAAVLDADYARTVARGVFA